MASSTIPYSVPAMNLGNLSGVDASAVESAFNALPDTESLIIGEFAAGGKWIFMGLKYTGGQYGMMLAVCFGNNSQWVLHKVNGTVTTKRITLS